MAVGLAGWPLKQLVFGDRRRRIFAAGFDRVKRVNLTRSGSLSQVPAEASSFPNYRRESIKKNMEAWKHQELII